MVGGGGASRPERRRFAILTSVRLLPRAGRWLTAAFAIVIVWNGLQGILSILATGVLIDALPAAAHDGLSSPSGRRLLAALAALALIFVFGRGIEPLQTVLTTSLARRFQRLVQRTLLRATCRPEGIAHLEDAHMADRLAIASGETAGVPASFVVYRLAQVVPPYIQALVAAVLLAGFRWWAPLLLAAGVLVERVWVTRMLDTAVRGMELQASALRRAGYFRDLALRAETAKELRAFGLGEWMLTRFRDHWHRAMEPIWRERQGHTLLAVGATAAITLSYGGVAVAVAVAAARGQIDIGRVAVFLGAASAMTAVIWMADPEWGLRASAQAVRHAVELDRDLPPVSTVPARIQRGNVSVDGLPRREIRFEAVEFRYPGSGRAVLRGLDLTIPAGRSLAVVGQNGAGKTTLIKLLARLYEPTGGRITVDGAALAELDLRSWRRRLAVIFQDFARYELSVRENVGFGSPRLLDAEEPAAIARALRRAGAEEIVKSLPRGLDTVLSRRFRDGADLSGGEWQRIALARCFAAVEGGAGVLVLDEPTSSLDVRAEAELFDRFLGLTRGLTTILISHRFSTVRHADRIVVVDDGRVVEEGTHEELLARAGRYALMFHLQAQRFRQDGRDYPGAGATDV